MTMARCPCSKTTTQETRRSYIESPCSTAWSCGPSPGLCAGMTDEPRARREPTNEFDYWHRRHRTGARQHITDNRRAADQARIAQGDKDARTRADDTMARLP